MNAASTPPAHHLAEEQDEINKHVGLYRCDDPERLRMIPSDWEKLSGAEPSGPYLASMQALGDIRGLRVLDAGAGDGWMSVILAKLGATVSAIDLSPEAIETARSRVEVNGVAHQVDLHVASFYRMPFADGSFDLVIGQAILHHLRDKPAAAAELRRVLKPGGRAYFVEALGGSGALERLRLMVPVPSDAPEDPDHWKDKISYADIDIFRGRFEVGVQEFHLFSRLDRVVKAPRVVRTLNRMDAALLGNLPFLRRFGRMVLIRMN